MNLSTGIRAISMASVLALGVPSAANAATFLTFDGSDGVFGNDDVTSGTFSDTFLIDVGVDAGLFSATLSSIASGDPASNVDFTTVTLNGVDFDIVQAGMIEFQTIQNAIVSGGIQTLLISGTSGGNGSYSGTLAFEVAAVPEPATWAFMIFGFGAIGGAMRRQRKANVKVSYA
ncbi:MAG: FxDxF family PEP-CTERM protein [Parasphingorhabdus sp.]|uniref:FxDxF family PEP-CTERM protein n=1 Tax=Parasphingorhabdus sp. TaxID=2709688 RepID=UPI003296FE83